MTNKFFTSKLFYILVSVFFAIVLFFNASAISIRNEGLRTSGEVYTTALSNVPIELKYDSNKYFVSGYNSVATVHLSGYNRLQISNEENTATRDFYLSADLTKVAEGTSNVPVRIEQLPNGVDAEISPTTISVTIEKKATENFDVKSEVNPTQLPTGFSVASVSLSESKVKVTAGVNSIKKIKRIVAELPSDVLLTDNYSGTVALRAVDSKGKIQSAQISPANVKLKVSVDKLSKTVPLNVKMTGTMDSSLSDIKTSLSDKNVRIYGEQTALDKIKSIDVPVDITNVTQQKKVEVTLSGDDISIRPHTVEVTLQPVVKKTN
ncbi:YbbR-like domain-containing protein [Lactococcus nasutitermitis]|uniref:YbbR-like domain-containing protein n=1 Tax=Lactococcus nasutitermitis TaxID=1652957 RepID=A0ABV9JEN1_9LACT|nr:CdaR family protein [Lactococcus nasutitermitis]